MAFEWVFRDAHVVVIIRTRARAMRAMAPARARDRTDEFFAIAARARTALDPANGRGRAREGNHDARAFAQVRSRRRAVARATRLDDGRTRGLTLRACFHRTR